jgi:hypothetical protein
MLLSTALLVSSVRSGGNKDGNANKNNGAGGGLAPAVVPTDRTPSPLESLVGGGSPAGAGETGTAATPRPSRPAYDSGKGTRCAGLDVTRTGNTMHVSPIMEGKGNPDPTRFFTVVDFMGGQTNKELKGGAKTYVGEGYNAPVDVPVPDDLSWQQHLGLVTVAFYPEGASVPGDPEGFSSAAGPGGRVMLACGNAVTTLLLQGGHSELPPQA